MFCYKLKENYFLPNKKQQIKRQTNKQTHQQKKQKQTKTVSCFEILKTLNEYMRNT